MRLPQEQRAALERLRRCRAYGGTETIEQTHGNYGPQFLWDEEAVVKLALALFAADDDEPAELGVVYENARELRRIEVMISGVGELSAYLTTFEHGAKPMRLCVVKTRGDVRRLLAALGGDVKGGA